MVQKQSKELLKLNKFLDDLANNTPNGEQFKKKDLGKKQRNNLKSRKMQVLSRRNSKYR